MTGANREPWYLLGCGRRRPRPMTQEIEKTPSKMAGWYSSWLDGVTGFKGPPWPGPLGVYATLQGAIGACELVVDEYLFGTYKPGKSGKELFEVYVGSGLKP